MIYLSVLLHSVIHNKHIHYGASLHMHFTSWSFWFPLHILSSLFLQPQEGNRSLSNLHKVYPPVFYHVSLVFVLCFVYILDFSYQKTIQNLTFCIWSTSLSIIVSRSTFLQKTPMYSFLLLSSNEWHLYTTVSLSILLLTDTEANSNI